MVARWPDCQRVPKVILAWTLQREAYGDCAETVCSQGGWAQRRAAVPGGDPTQAVSSCTQAHTPFMRHGLEIQRNRTLSLCPHTDCALSPHMCPLLRSWLSLWSSPRTEALTATGRLPAPRAGLPSTASSRTRTSSFSLRLRLWLKTEASREEPTGQAQPLPSILLHRGPRWS